MNTGSCPHAITYKAARKSNQANREIRRINSDVRSREPVKRYITKLTGIDNDTLCKAKYFSKVGNSFLDWVWSNAPDHEIEFIEWGTNEKNAFNQCCEYYKINSLTNKIEHTEENITKYNKLLEHN